MSALPGTTGRRRIYLMRHGFVDYTSAAVRKARDPKVATLTDRGIDEARAAGVALSDVHFDLAICSGLPRTRQTAEIVLAEHPKALELEVEPRFGELRSGSYMDFHSAEHLAAVMTFTFEQAGEPDAEFLPGGERFADAMVRVREGLHDLLMRPSWASALVVAHEVVNRMVLADVIGAPLGASAGFEQDTGCINILDFDLVPNETGEGTRVERGVIKAVNLTPANYLKNGMNLRSLEAIFTRPE
ncbi:MAG: histidine phosphatase family protein [Hyphomonas sp.]|uniref:histidine phosphatase family protein n=1 Tax=Hyphomonas sp. TaxID=87 RepID=UPI00181531DA|nr:histidine phosphatase family protein [Hyphomonas sp.]MBU3922603.1 histidine phosphatase family protein [Alphaproteobacteria bacterium]MBA3067217.1 histidine phosphatase family protein [Hyphomonas sp.]MBU4061173.1 histidine phosphatase family protein [Alphaproteobacteria bacterium]MBU4165085.1 histidine phosphatase family protein [Alphaproteobacteria bacterium]MBU4568540.1 histidine phosphatase family protein [Alphaproteobacteria bacterium]